MVQVWSAPGRRWSRCFISVDFPHPGSPLNQRRPPPLASSHSLKVGLAVSHWQVSLSGSLISLSRVLISGNDRESRKAALAAGAL